MGAKFTLVRYGKYDYGHFGPRIEEVPAHFDIASISPTSDYILHTEYSYGPRRFDLPAYQELPTLRAATFHGIPLLWHSIPWSEEFAQRLVSLVASKPVPKLIEVHPPYVDYCGTLPIFLNRYAAFERRLKDDLPNVDIVIENRIGSLYKNPFLVQQSCDIVKLSEEILRTGCSLRVVLDIPQLFASLNMENGFALKTAICALEGLRPYRTLIVGVHIWGHDGRAHVGDLKSLFDFKNDVKQVYLEFLSDFLDDGQVRYLVPEVNSAKQKLFDEIMCDLSEYFSIH